MRRSALLACFALALQAQNPASGNNNTAWQMQQQQFQAQRMFQMQQQMQRQMQMQQQQMAQQRMQQQLMNQAAQAQRVRQQEAKELAAHRIALPPALLAKPAGAAWEAALGQTKTFPAYDGQRLIVVAGPHTLRSLDLATGKVLWEATMPEKLALDPMLVGDFLIYANRNQMLVILDADTGKERTLLQLDALDTYSLSNRSNHPRMLYPAILGDRIILATYGKGNGAPTGWIYSIDLPTGKVSWKVDFPGGPDLTPVLMGEQVLTGGAGRVLALDVADGKQRWEVRLGGSEEIKEGPLVGSTYTVIFDKQLHALDAAKGTKLWSAPFSGRPILQGEGDRLIYSDYRGVFVRSEWLVAVDAKTGQPAWERKLGASRIPWIQEGKVLCNADETLMALDLTTGKPVWTCTLAEAPAIPLAIFGESLYAVVGTGSSARLKALKLADGSAAWETSCPAPHEGGMLMLTDQGFLFPREDKGLALLH